MQKLKIPQNHSGISKTLRLPENLVKDIQILAEIKNIFFNKVVSELLEFSLKNLDEEDEKIIEEKRYEIKEEKEDEKTIENRVKEKNKDKDKIKNEDRGNL